MKRLFALVIVGMLLCAPALADAVTFDFETSTLEELTALRDQINARIFEILGAKEVTFAQGLYVAGKDIAPGAYTVTCGENVESAFLYVYAPESERWYNYDHFYALGSFHACTQVGKLTLDAGAKIDIQGANLVFTPYAGAE